MVLLALAGVGLAVGAAARLLGNPGAADAAWAAITSLGLVAATWWGLESARRGRLGVDVIAVLALAGSLVVGEYLAGCVITLMLATGRSIEARAGARARSELRSLVERAPRRVHRHVEGELEAVDLEAVTRGDVLLVRPGEVVPVDGSVVDGMAVLDESALTGEPLPVEHPACDSVRSGVVNAGGPFDLRATTTAAESTYAGIVRLVERAQASSAPFVRLADRYAVVFLIVTLVGAGAAWALSGEAVRAVAVLVVATPCPLILAAPIAIVSGLSRAARRGVLLKGGAVLERLADGEVLLFDKTGTLTEGRPTLSEIVSAGTVDVDEALRLAASLDQLSPHVLAGAVVRAARERDLSLSLPTAFEEVRGRGAVGTVEGRAVAVGKVGWLVPGSPSWLKAVRRRAELDGALTVFVTVDREPAGAMIFEDPIRNDAARTVRKLRHDGIGRIVMVTGDRADVAQTVGAVIGVDEVLAERSPSEKVEAVQEAGRGRHTIMVGDGINDAPALAVADVGVAIGARGSSASSEAADVILTADRLDRLGDGIVIARRARDIARQSVVAGIGMSLAAMVVAGLGFLPPAWGALLQEFIDVAVIANALRALVPHEEAARVSAREAALVQQFSEEHRVLRPDVDRLRRAADQIGVAPPAEALRDVREVHRFLVEEIEPHEQSEDAILYPVFARVIGGTDPTGTMSRAHVEISHLIRRLGGLLDDIDPATPDDEDLLELRRTLYGLHAILRLHFAQEDEGYLSLIDEPDAAGRGSLPNGGLAS